MQSLARLGLLSCYFNGLKINRGDTLARKGRNKSKMPITTDTQVPGVYTTTLSRAQWDKARVIGIMKVKEKRKESESIVG